MLLASGCPGSVMCEIGIINKTDEPIAVYYIPSARGAKHYTPRITQIYPDTSLLADRPIWEDLYFAPNTICGYAYIPRQLDQFTPMDTAYIVVIHQDTLNKYTWEEICKRYNVIGRYKMSIDNLIPIELFDDSVVEKNIMYSHIITFPLTKISDYQ